MRLIEVRVKDVFQAKEMLVGIGQGSNEWRVAIERLEEMNEGKVVAWSGG